MTSTDFRIAITIPVAKGLIDAVAADDQERVAWILGDVAEPDTLMVMLAAVIDPLLLDDADFPQVQYNHPALSYHAGRYENGDRDLLATRCYVHRQSIPTAALEAGTVPHLRKRSA